MHVREEVVRQTVRHGADLVKTYCVLVGIVVCVRTVTTVGGGPMVLSDGIVAVASCKANTACVREEVVHQCGTVRTCSGNKACA